jgi:hypothetical protein
VPDQDTAAERFTLGTRGGETVAAASQPAATSGGATVPGEDSRGAGNQQVIIVPGVARYHRPDCRLLRFVRDQDMQSVTREHAVASGCVPCRDCQPEPLPTSTASASG